MEFIEIAKKGLPDTDEETQKINELLSMAEEHAKEDMDECYGVFEAEKAQAWLLEYMRYQWLKDEENWERNIQRAYYLLTQYDWMYFPEKLD